MFLVIRFCSAGLIDILEGFITILYDLSDFKKHSGLGSFAWKAIVYSRKVFLFTKVEGKVNWYKDKDFNLA